MMKRSKCCGADAFKWTMEYNKDFESIEGIAYRCTKCKQWCETITPKKTIAEVVPGWPARDKIPFEHGGPIDDAHSYRIGCRDTIIAIEGILKPYLIKLGVLEDKQKGDK